MLTLKQRNTKWIYYFDIDFNDKTKEIYTLLANGKHFLDITILVVAIFFPSFMSNLVFEKLFKISYVYENIWTKFVRSDL